MQIWPGDRQISHPLANGVAFIDCLRCGAMEDEMDVHTVPDQRVQGT